MALEAPRISGYIAKIFWLYSYIAIQPEKHGCIGTAMVMAMAILEQKYGLFLIYWLYSLSHRATSFLAIQPIYL